jgi:hypothetical protein
MLRTMSLQHLLGTVKGAGLLNPKVQKILQNHCEAGRILEVAEVVAKTVFDQALVDRTMPEPQGIKTKELHDRAADAAKHLAEQYARRGVLVAKEFLPASQLALIILRMWEEQFSSVLRNPEEHHDLVEGVSSDFITRQAVAAQAVRDLLARLPTTSDGEGLILPMKEVEGFCVRSVKAMHAAFVNPDVAVHKTLHGEEPKEHE